MTRELQSRARGAARRQGEAAGHVNVAAMAWQAEAAQLRHELHALKAQLAEKETLEARRQEPKARIAA